MNSLFDALNPKPYRPPRWREGLALCKAFRRRSEKLEKYWKRALKVDNSVLKLLLEADEREKNGVVPLGHEEEAAEVIIPLLLEFRDDAIDSMFKSMTHRLRALEYMEIVKCWNQ